MPLEYVNMFMLSPMCSFYPFCPTFCLEIGSSLLGSEAISRKTRVKPSPNWPLARWLKYHIARILHVARIWTLVGWTRRLGGPRIRFAPNDKPTKVGPKVTGLKDVGCRATWHLRKSRIRKKKETKERSVISIFFLLLSFFFFSFLKIFFVMLNTWGIYVPFYWLE